MKQVVILGSTGNIGCQTLEVINWFSHRFQVYGLAAGSNDDLLLEQIREYNPRKVSISSEQGYKRLKEEVGGECQLLFGDDGLNELTEDETADIVVNALVGGVGLLPSVNALKSGKRLCLANKETLVATGGRIYDYTADGAEIIPVDSEHSAIFQLLEGVDIDEVNSIILTASGGPFWKSKRDLSQVSIDDVLAHPTWNMGPKITVDSATMMNKGFEVIEACTLFKVDVEKITVVIHPQSLVHSMIQLVDGVIMAHISPPDMRHNIQYALLYPERLPNPTQPFDITAGNVLSFHPIDYDYFPCLRLAEEVARKGGNLSAYLVGADDRVTRAFLSSQISFDKIPFILENTIEKAYYKQNPSLEEIIQAIDNGFDLADEQIKELTERGAK